MNTSRHSVHNTYTSPHLLNALRTLFDTLDRKHGSQGYIKFQDLVEDFNYEQSHRELWQLLPNGFLDYVKKVIPFNGMLTYERLCAGLRLATRGISVNGDGSLTSGGYQDNLYVNGYQYKNGVPAHNVLPSTNPVIRAQQRQSVHNSLSTGSSRNSSPSFYPGPPAAPPRGQDSVEKMQRRLDNFNGNSNGSNYDYVNQHSSPYRNSVDPIKNNGGGYLDQNLNNQWAKPNGYERSNVRTVSPSPNSFSTSALNGKRPNANGVHRYQNNNSNGNNNVNGHNQPQQYPPPYNQALSLSKMELNKAEVPENGLKFHNDKMSNLTKSTPHLNGKTNIYQNGHLQNDQFHNGQHQQASFANGNGIVRVSPVSQQFEIAHSRPVAAKTTTAEHEFVEPVVKLRQKKAHNAVNNLIIETRRHTLSECGSDQNMLKHTRILHEEKDLIVKGQETTTRLQDWFSDRLSKLETRHKLMGKSMIPLDYAVHEEKLNYLRAHVTELNRRMVALMESSEKGFPSYINVEVSRSIPQPTDDQVMWLKRQNKMLTEEVTEKTQRIAVLEVEKASLVKKVYENKSQASPNNNETVYSLPVKNNNHHVQLIKPSTVEPNNRYSTLM